MSGWYDSPLTPGTLGMPPPDKKRCRLCGAYLAMDNLSSLDGLCSPCYVRESATVNAYAEAPTRVRAFKHGGRSGYEYHECRCLECCEANARHSRRNYYKKKGGGLS